MALILLYLLFPLLVGMAALPMCSPIITCMCCAVVLGLDGMLGCGETPVVLGSVDASDVAVLVCVGTGVVGSGGGGDGGVVGGVGDVGDGGGGIGIVCGVVIMALGGAVGGEAGGGVVVGGQWSVVW